MKRTVLLLLAALMLAASFAACGTKTDPSPATEKPAGNETSTAEPEKPVETEAPEATAEPEAESKINLPDGVYLAEFKTDGSMFHINEAHHGKGVLTVENGVATMHITLPSKNTVNLYPGLAEDAKKPDAVLLQPTLDTVTYDDGMTEEVYGFDIPVPVIGEEFDMALVGTKGKWYDHKVLVLNPVPQDGSYTIGVALEGGTGKAKIQSPAALTVANGGMTLTVTWSSDKYDYMIADGEKLLPQYVDGHSVFSVPVASLDTPLQVVADTTAMSTPHEIEYTITFDAASLTPAS